MPHGLQRSKDGLALRVTTPVRDAKLVEEDSDGTPTRLADVYVYNFDDLVLVVDGTRIPAADRAELVEVAAGKTDSIYRGALTELQLVEGEYEVPLPGCTDAGFYADDHASVVTAEGLLIIHDDSNRQLVDELATIRHKQQRGTERIS